MTEPITLAAGAWTTTIAPDLGGALLSLRHAGRPLLRETPNPASVRATAAYAMLPYANRIANARFTWQGEAHALRPNFPPEPHALHGAGWQCPWAVKHADATSAHLTLTHTPDQDWPFAFTAAQRITLDATGLTVILSLTNTGPRPMPAGLGYHPYFLCTQATRLKLKASTAADCGPDNLPGDPRPCPEFDGQTLFPAGDTNLDADLDGWDGTVTLTEPGQPSLHLRAPSRFLRLFTPRGRGFAAIEPVTHAANAINRPDPASLGLVTLAPGGTLTLPIRITAA